MAAHGEARVSIEFEGGTLVLDGLPEEVAAELATWDARATRFRAPALAYADIVRRLVRSNLPFEDRAKRYDELSGTPRVHRESRPYQTEALEAWRSARCRGVVVLPTGAGKTHVATLAILDRKRATLVVVPTLDLVRQWFDLLQATFGGPIGLVGGGEHDIQPITVATYDSAYLHVERLGARFGLVVFDECHHLPSGAYALAARGCIAPYRLGLSATLERSDGRERDLDELIGPTVYSRDITEFAGEWLAEYETIRVAIDLAPHEREEYEAERALYRQFLSKHHIHMSGPEGWGQFILLSSRSPEGKRAMRAYRRQRQLAFAAPAKLDYLEHLLDAHASGRSIVFTMDNATAYEVSRRFLVPVITHQTKVRERSQILKMFREGTINAIATSRVLNEGVDVPEADVAVVLSGTGSVREHVQRLGRILRKRDGKQAVLYELVTRRTTEVSTSDRRREHGAYR